ncbi:hypothetical protein K470DRAFT_292514 [Piedraia hortae CBS 480.64]|uniref:Large ribosomal subunit protein mL50 n=1 Tax=Piedraia hortae CBS 480.64 TaxID=1314780 RepID=A0A6A7C9T8_9PEZI|nr:hypothetical protein K470DRAFT_292514 [Piedraia hortae CBS 480.64]
MNSTHITRTFALERTIHLHGRLCTRGFSYSAALAAAAKKPWYQRLKDSFLPRWREAEEEKVANQLPQREEEEEESVVTVTDSAWTLRKGSGGRRWRYLNPAEEGEYTPSSNWDGLERIPIGGGRVFEETERDALRYSGFVPKEAKIEDQQWVKLMHHVVVEAFLMQRNGVLEKLCNHRTGKAMTRHGAIVLRDGQLDVAISDDVVSSVVKRASDALPSVHDLREELGEALVKDTIPGGVKWSRIPLGSDELKFAICKRVVQLTGKRVTDNELHRVKTLGDLCNLFKAKPKPRKLAETTEFKELRWDIPNVAVFKRRQTPMDKDKSVGRWKVIKEELEKRDLPITGSRYIGAKLKAR